MSATAIHPIHRAVRFYEARIGKKAVICLREPSTPLVARQSRCSGIERRERDMAATSTYEETTVGTLYDSIETNLWQAGAYLRRGDEALAAELAIPLNLAKSEAAPLRAPGLLLAIRIPNIHLLRNTGFRFSAKAAIPSLRSSKAKVD